MDSQTTDIDITHFVIVFHSQLKHWKHYETQLITYDIYFS